jgi:hypothetical protein
MDIELHFDEALVRTIARRFIVRTFGVGGLVAAAAMVACALYLVTSGAGLSFSEGIIIGLAMVPIIALPLCYVVITRRGLGVLRDLGQAPATLRLREDRIETSNPIGASSLAWSAIKEVWRFPEAWLLFVGKGMYFTIPLRDIGPDAQEFIRAHAAAAGAKIR